MCVCVCVCDFKPFMSVRRDAEPMTAELTRRQRLGLLVGTSLSADEVLKKQDSDFDFSFFLAHGIRAPLLKALKISPTQLKSRGVKTARDLHSLEYNALDLVDGAFCASCVSAFGAEEVLTEFLVTPNDAVTLAGTSAMVQLGLDVPTLLVLCAGQPTLAAEALGRCAPRGARLTGVAPTTLLDTGLRSQQLHALGYGPEAVAAQTRATAIDLEKLGF